MMCSSYCFFYKQKTAYEMRISDWSSDVCSSDLGSLFAREYAAPQTRLHPSRVSDAGAAWRSYEAEVMAEPAARAERVADEADEALHRSEERRVGKEWVSKSRSRWAP